MSVKPVPNVSLFHTDLGCQGGLAANNLNRYIEWSLHVHENTNLLVLNQQGNLGCFATRFFVMSEIKDRVLKRRKLLGMTQDELAKKAGVKQQSIQQLEDGVVKRPRYLLELSAALQCDANWLVTGKGEADLNLAGQPGIPGSGKASINIPPEFNSLLTRASPRSYKQLLRILEAAADGRLSDDDIYLLNLIVERISAKE